MIIEFRETKFTIHSINNTQYFVPRQNLYYCKNEKIYINVAYIKDGIADCPSNEDELNNNANFNLNVFFCKNKKKVISMIALCNYIEDCSDGSDEKFCGLFKKIFAIYLKWRNYFVLFF